MNDAAAVANEPTSVLVVEDDESREVIARYLEVEAGWKVQKAETAHDARRLIQERPDSFDGIVLDRRMPNEKGVLDNTGDALARWLFDENRLSSTTLIMLTGYGDVSVARAVLVMGGWNFLEKPVRPREVHRLLAPGIARRRAQALLSWVHSGPPVDEVVDRIGAIIRSTLAPDQFRVYFHSNGVIQNLSDGSSRPHEPRFVKTALEHRIYVYGGTAEDCRELEAENPDTCTLMAVRVQAFETAEAVGVIAMESHIRDAFDARWRWVLNDMAELIATSMTVRRSKERAVEAEHQLGKAELRAVLAERDSLKMLTREFRHRIATSAGTMYQHLELLTTDLATIGAPAESAISKAEVIRRHLGFVVNVMRELDLAAKDMPGPQPRRFEIVPLVGVVLSEELAGRSVRPVLEAPQPDIAVWADYGLVDYVLRCLIRNSVESLQSRNTRPKLAKEDGSFDDQYRRAAGAVDRDLEVTIKERPEAGTAEVRVKDWGMGFTDEIKERLFNALFTTKLSRNTEAQDTRGLGLYSAKRYVEGMGGTISAFSAGELEGAEFTITLPLESAGRG